MEIVNMMKNNNCTEYETCNADVIDSEIEWFINVMNTRFDQYFSADDDPKKMLEIYDIEVPSYTNDGSSYARFINDWKLSFDERIILVMALIPHVRPSVFDMFFIQNKNLGRAYTEFGGWSGKNHVGFLPTCETVSFILAGDDLQKKLNLMQFFCEDHFFRRLGVLKVDHQSSDEPFWAGALIVTNEYLNRFTTGQIRKPDYGAEFPARLITSKLCWDDLVLEPDVREDIAAIETWLTYSEKLLKDWGLEKNIKPGYRCLFYGPPGTGKTLTATLLGASSGLDVYRIDLSMVVSKYIGETEKNLANIFDQAERRNWILFFDEADALFSKRTQTNSSNDRHANQEVAYLLQRIEDCPNMIILASNLKANIDDAFMRRFQSAIYFPMPGPEQRLQLWKGMFPKKEKLGPDVNFQKLADEYEMSGGSIINVARCAVLRALKDGRDFVMQEDLVEWVRKELVKEGKIV